MEDYPRTLLELERGFSTEAACREYLEHLRWPQGVQCPRCAGAQGWRTTRGHWACSGCGYQASVTAGTIFQDTRLPLRLWFRAIWWVTAQKNGASAQGVQRILGLGSYRTAWTWLHKLRRAMVRPGREQLVGPDEVDEAFLGGAAPGGGRRHIGKKALVLIATEIRGKAMGRVRLARVRDSSAESLLPFIQRTVVLGARVITDGLPTYLGLPRLGYQHEKKVIQGSGEDAHTLLPHVHTVASLLQRWLLGTHQGGVSRQHLDYDLDEFTFRFNRRTSRSRGKLFFRLVEQAVVTAPAPYASIIKQLGRGPRKKGRLNT